MNIYGYILESLKLIAFSFWIYDYLHERRIGTPTGLQLTFFIGSIILLPISFLTIIGVVDCYH